jgi:Tfp pilus assembly protein PilE
MQAISEPKVRMRQTGFTMMELLVGVSTMMVLSMVAAPLATTYLQRYQLTATAEQLAFEIHRARMQAVAQNLFVRVRVVDGTYVREESSTGVTYTASDTEVEMPDGLTISAGDAGGPVFTRNGLANATTAITISRGDAHKVVRTNLVGRVTIQ